MVAAPGSARLSLAGGVRFLNEPRAVFDAMLDGWSKQQGSRMLSASTIRSRVALVSRFQQFADAFPWQWTPADVEEFTVTLTCGGNRLALSTIRGYHMTLRMFCDYLTDTRYEWLRVCDDRFGMVPSQVCHEWNTVAHLNDYEGRPQRRPLTYAELQLFMDWFDDRVDRVAKSGRKGGLAALRDSAMMKTCYAFGLRRNELARLDVADLRPNPHMPQWGTYGSVHVRFGKATKGSLPRRRTVLAVPEFDWAVDGLRLWVEQARPLYGTEHPALWLTERLTRTPVRNIDLAFATARDDLGLDKELSLHCLRHSYVTHLVEHGYPERFVTEQVGHHYASTTAIYTSVSNDFKNKALKAALERVYRKEGDER